MSSAVKILDVPMEINFTVEFPGETTKRKANLTGIEPTTTVEELGGMISRFVTDFWTPRHVLGKYKVNALGVFKSKRSRMITGWLIIDGPGTNENVRQSMIGQYGINPLSLDVRGKYVSDSSLFPSRVRRGRSGGLETPATVPQNQGGAAFDTPEEDDDADLVVLNPRVHPVDLFGDDTVPPPFDPNRKFFDDDEEVVRGGLASVRKFRDSFGGGDLPLDDDEDTKRMKTNCKVCQAKIGVLQCKSCKKVAYCGALCYSKDKRVHCCKK